RQVAWDTPVLSLGKMATVVVLARDSELNSFNSGKEKQHGSVNDTINDTVVLSSAVDELDYGNTNGNHEGNA
ncbi:hypothetical protein Tco_0651418, partial [Tanacetum coccineum]